MRKGMSPSKYTNCPFHFVPQPLVVEEFRPITDQAVPGIKPYYMISNYGRIFHIYENRFLSWNMDSKGYLFKPLATVNGMKNCRIHRLVMMTFCYFPGCEDLLVNHKDGIKTNCYIGNLEWTTHSENTIHAINNGLISKSGKYNEEQIHNVCMLLQDGRYTLNQIAEMSNVSYSVIQGIQGKRAYTDISDQYNIQPRKVNNNLTEDEVRLICQFFVNNPKDPKDYKTMNLDQYCTLALQSIGITEINTRYLKTVKKIFARTTYNYISKDYNF